MSTEWITDRRPRWFDTNGNVNIVYNSKGMIARSEEIGDGEAWRPIPHIEPYVKPKRFTAKWDAVYQRWSVVDKRYEYDIVTIRLPYLDGEHNDEHREAAEEIAAIYERTMP